MLSIVYINLDRDVQRREHIEAQLASLPFPYSRLPGVLWGALDPLEQARLYDPALNARQWYRPLADGEKGCYASHLHACEYLLASSAPALVVLEDDVVLQPAFADVVEAVARLPAHGWDIIKLYSRENERPIWARPLAQQHQLVAYRRIPSMCNGYVLTRSGASKLLSCRRPFGRPVDVDMRYWWECDLCVRGVVPSVVSIGPESQESSIWRDGRLRRTWPERWRRAYLQWGYTWRNAWHARRQVL